MSYSHQGIPTQIFQSENNLLQQVNKIKQLGNMMQSAYIKADWDKSPKIPKLFSLIAFSLIPFPCIPSLSLERALGCFKPST